MRRATTGKNHRNRRAIRAILSAAGAVGGLSGGHAALAQVVGSDNLYTYTGGASGLFSTGFTPTFTSDGSGELLFNVSGAAITDDLPSASINALAFTSSGTTTLTQQGSSSNVLTFTTNATSVTPTIYVGTGSSAALGMIVGGSAGLTIGGGGSLSFNGAAAETYTGTTTVKNATLTLDYTNYTGNNLVGGGTGSISLSGGSLNMLGNADLTSNQTFATTGLAGGLNTISVSGANTPTLALGAITYTAGSAVVFNGVATNNSATTTGQANLTAEPALSPSSTPAGTITTSTAGGTGGLLGGLGGSGTTGTDYATVGLYDWAVNSGGSIVGGSQVASFYTILAGANNNTADQNYDVTANSTLSGGGSSRVTINSFRFNTPTALTVTFNAGQQGHNGNPINIDGMLMTPNVAANNVTIAENAADVIESSNTTLPALTIWQNDTQGELIFLPNADTVAEPSIAGNAFVQAGPGTVWFDGNTNSYTGQTYLNGGVLEINTDDLGGAVSVQTLTLNGGTLVGNYTGSLDGGSVASAHPVALGNNGGGVAATAGKTFTIDGVISGAAGTGALVIGIPASSANGNTVGLLPGTGLGTLTANAAVSATGTVILSNASNTYTGGTVLDSGTLDLNAGTLSVLGTGSVTLNGGTLFYANSAAAATDLSTRTVTVSGNSVIDVNGNAVTYGSSIGNGGAGSITLQSTALGGTLTLNGSTFTGAVTVNSGAGLVLNGSHVFSGATTINSGGTLTANAGASLGNTAISDSGTANFNAGSGNIQIGSTSASLTLNSGAAFSMADANFGKVTLNSVGGGTAQALTLNGNNSAAAILTFDLGATTTGGTLLADELIVNNGTVGFGGTNNVIKLSTAGLSAPANGVGTVTLISVPNGGLPALASTDFSLFSPSFSIAGNNYAGTLSVSGNQLLLTISPFTASLDFYYTARGGDAIVGGAGANFVTTAGGGTLQTSAPGASNNLFFTANSSADNTPSLDASVAVNSVSFTGTGSAGTLGTTLGTTSASNVLTINAANGFKNSAGTSYAAGVGLVVQAGSGSNSIAANITLGGSQSWEIDNSPTNPLTVSGNVGGGAALSKTGSGVLVLAGSNSYSGGTNVNAGTLQLGSSSGLPSTGILTVQGTGVLNLNGNSASTAGLSDGGVSTGSITSAGAATLTVSPTSPFSFGGTIGGATALTIAGSSTQTISGNNSYTGLTTVSSGTLNATSNSALGSPTSATGGLSMSGTATVDFSSTSPAIASLNGASTDAIVLGNSAGSGAPTTLTVGGGNTSSVTNTFAGVISDLSSTPATLAVGNLTVAGSGTIILSGANTFTGITAVGGTATLQLGTPAALQDSTLNYNGQGGTLSFGALTSATLGGLTGSQPLALTNTSSAAVALLIGNNASNTTYTGLLGGAGSVIKTGSDAVTLGSGTLGGATYAGTTFVNSGTLTIGGISNLAGNIDLTGDLGASFLVIQDSAVVRNSTIYVDTGDADGGSGANANGGASTLTIGGNAAVTTATFAFGNPALSNRVGAGTDLTVQGNATFDVTGTFEILNDQNGTATGGNTTLATANLNGGTLGVGSFALLAGGNGTQNSVLNFNGGMLVALQSDSSGGGSGIFMPSSTHWSTTILAGGAFINTNGFDVEITNELTHGSGTPDGGLTKLGAGTLTLRYATNPNNYTGGTTIDAGDLNIDTIYEIGGAAYAGITLNGGTLQYASSLTGDGYDDLTANNSSAVEPFVVGASGGTVDLDAQAISFANAITGTGSLTVTDSLASPSSGLQLNGTSSYAGSTTVSSTTLAINGALTNSGTINVNASTAATTLLLDGANAVPATAAIIGTGTFGPTITVNANQTIGSINSVGSTTFQNASISTIGPIDGIGSLNVVGTSSLTASHIRQSSLTIDGTSTVTIAPNGTSTATSVLTNLSNSGTLDLKNNDLIVGTDPGVGTLIASAYNHGAWNQPGITSSSALAHTGYNLGYATIGSGAGQLNISTFDGQPVSSGNVAVEYTLNGDLNLDNSVDQNDIALLAPHYGTTSGATWYQGDVNHDGSVDQNDIALIAPNYGQTANAPGNALTPGIKTALTRSAAPNLSSSGLSGGAVSPAITHLYTWDAALPDATAGNVIIKVDNTTGDSHFGDVILQGNSATLYTLVITSTSGSMNSGRYDSLNAQYNGGGGSEAATLQGLAVDNTTNHSGNFSVFSQTANKINEAGLGVTLDFTSNAESVDLSTKANNKNLFSGITPDLAFSWSGQNGTLVSGTVEYTVTPEPGMLGMLGVGGVMMMRRRRQWAKV